MTKYELAKLAIMLGGFHSRKRIQKTIHLMQAAGCDFGLDFRLHYYGPYSFELAECVDSMAKDRMLLESTCETQFGTQFDYEFNVELHPVLERYEQTESGRREKEKLESFAGLLTQLNEKRPRILELAATIVAFRQAGNSWDEAARKASDYKAEPTLSPQMQEANELALEVLRNVDGR